MITQLELRRSSSIIAGILRTVKSMRTIAGKEKLQCGLCTRREHIACTSDLICAQYSPLQA